MQGQSGPKKQALIILSAASALLFVTVVVSGDRQASGRRVESGEPKGFRSPCGTANQVSSRVGRCLDEIFDMIEGKFPDPKSDVELVEDCERFNRTERCVRIVAKDCLSGIHKTATGAVASATKRFRIQECRSAASRAKYIEPLRCAIRKGKEMKQVYQNYTAMMQGVRDLPNISPEDKLIKMCCVLNNLDKELETRYNRDCPKQTPYVMGIVRAMSDDARSTLCVNPKCKDQLNKVIGTPYKPGQNFIEPVAQILYMLSVD